jgi:hypothetical protein
MTAMKPPASISYPDVSDILARKAEARREIARLSFGQKIAMVEDMRERLVPFKKARKERSAPRSSQPLSDRHR